MKIFLKISLFILAFCTLPGLSKAQATFPFFINNTLTCPITVRWMVSCNSCPPPATPQTNPVQVIPPGAFILGPPVFNAATNFGWTPTNTQVSVLVIDIGGANLASLGLVLPYVDSGTPAFSGAGYPACAPPILSMTWSPTGVTIF